jgi:actin-related protein 6
MRAATQASASVIAAQTLIIDNGGHTIKAGFSNATPSAEDSRIIPNCIARGRDGPRSHRVYIAHQLDECKDFAEMAFRRPVEKGYVTSWEGELEVWKQAFFDNDAKTYVSLTMTLHGIVLTC